MALLYRPARMRSALALLLAMVGCSSPLPPGSRVDKLRVLAVRAEPPEVQPGQMTSLDTLTALPLYNTVDASAPVVTYLWLACVEAVGSSAPFPCTLPSGSDAGVTPNIPVCDSSTGTNLCLIGDGPTQRYTPTSAALDASGSSSASVLITVVVADQEAGGAVGCAYDASQGSGTPTNPDHCTVSLKRLTVSRSTTPNHNPTLASVTLDGAAIDQNGAAHWKLAPDNTTVSGTLSATRTPGSAEVKSDGTYETLFLSWYVSAGSLENRRSTFFPNDCPDACLKTDPPVTVTTLWDFSTAADAMQYAPTGEVLLWAILHDDQDGVGWVSGSAVKQ